MKRIYIAMKESNIPKNIKSELIKDDDSYYLIDTPENRVKFKKILPLGFSNEKIKLNIDLIPKTSWGASLAGSLSSESWDRIRKPFIGEYGCRCQICGQKGKYINNKIRDVDTHEIWSYEDITYEDGEDNVKLQKLEGFMSLCSSCHLMFHLGFARHCGKYDVTIKRIQRLEKLSDPELTFKLNEIFYNWKERSNFDWIVDITLLKEIGINDIKFNKKAVQSKFIY